MTFRDDYETWQSRCASRARARDSLRRRARTAERDHRCRRRRGRSRHNNPRRRQTSRWTRSGPHRRHRDTAAREARRIAGLRGILLAQRQWRDDRHRVGRGIRPADDADHDHQHAQRRRGARRGDRVAGAASQNAAAVVVAGGRRNLRRLAQRHRRISRHSEAGVGGARGRARRTRRRRMRRRRHRHDRLRLERRNRHRVAPARSQSGRLHDGNPGPAKLRTSARADNRGRSGRQGTSPRPRPLQHSRNSARSSSLRRPMRP